ncbi:hypothetical protein EIO_3329 (plasmid) [Ketogulonicigenium vulgare Y25]|nr:hypothetical protein EIO_3329 [Ketogulonicigenium vulgare Y25]
MQRPINGRDRIAQPNPQKTLALSGNTALDRKIQLKQFFTVRKITQGAADAVVQ